jgi:photosystem II stability/assembly factor-like uncharacterized protein
VEAGDHDRRKGAKNHVVMPANQRGSRKVTATKKDQKQLRAQRAKRSWQRAKRIWQRAKRSFGSARAASPPLRETRIRSSGISGEVSLESAEEDRSRCRKIHAAEKQHAIHTVTLDSARGLRFLSLLECQIHLSMTLR